MCSQAHEYMGVHTHAGAHAHTHMYTHKEEGSPAPDGWRGVSRPLEAQPLYAYFPPLRGEEPLQAAQRGDTWSAGSGEGTLRSLSLSP